MNELGLKLLLNVTCILILIAILFGVYIQKHKGDKLATKYTLVIYSTIFLIAINMIADILESNKVSSSGAFIINLFTFFTVDIVLLFFNNYLKALINKPDDKKNNILHLVVLVTSITRIIIALVLALTGNLFEIDAAGKYVEKSLYFIPYILSVISLIEFLLIVIMYRKQFTKREITVILIYELVPIPAVLIELFFGTYSLLGPVLTISLLLVFIFIQYATIVKGRDREKVLEELSNTDLLTNMNNRRAYYSFLDKLNKDDNIAVVFCDLNGLKKVNDHYGHSKGDELIKHFSTLLVNAFGNDLSFRISGDEFIAFVNAASEETANKKIEKCKKTVANENHISAVGSSFGCCCVVDKLISEAEKSMYEDKKLRALGRS